jgi:probable F420-dependent oxidoreductase
MKYGVHLGARGVVAHPDTLTAVARTAENAGYEHLGISDHVFVVAAADSKYPYSESGKFYAQDTGTSLEQITTIGFLASATSRIRLLTSVMVLPHRHPVLTAKMLVTADVLSKGRLTVGVGVGWNAEEIALLGGPPFADRAKASDAYIEGFRELWTKDRPSQKNPFASFDNLLFAPKPVQKPHPPIWVGGESAPALRRAGRLGDAWYPVAINPGAPFDTPDLYAEGLKHVRAAAEQAGRDPSKVAAAILAIHCRIGEPAKGRDGGRLAFTGSAQAIVDDIGAYRDKGLEHVIIGGDGSDQAGTIERLERFASEVMAKVG